MIPHPTILVVAGESSGDQHAAEFVAALRARAPGCRVLAVGGDSLRSAGAEIVADVADLAVVGIAEVGLRLPRFISLLRRLTRRLRSGEIDLLIPVDFPDFNFRLARAAHGAGVPVFYYIAPQAWAWREGRARDMARWCCHLGVIFPFEESFFRERGVETTYVGHPFLGRVHGERASEHVRELAGAGPRDRLVGLFPGSRRSEVARHLSVLIDAARRLADEDDRVRVAIGRAPTIGADDLAAVVPEEFTIVDPPAFDLMRAADVALTASGTATVEVAMADTPMLVLYRVSPLTWHIAKRLVRTPHVAMVNLIAEERLVPEFLQGAATPVALADRARSLLDDREERERIRAGYRRVRERLSGGVGFDRAAEIALGLVGTTHHV